MKAFIGDCLSALPWFMVVSTVRAGAIGGPLIGKLEMKTSDTSRTKALDEQLIKAIHENQRIIDKICHAYCRNSADKADLYQDIMCQVWVAYPKFKRESNFSTWFYSIALHTAVVRHRKIKRAIVEYRDELPEMAGNDPMNDGYDDRITRLFSRLDGLERAIVLLLMEGYKVSEIGTILKISAPAVTMRMSRLRKEIIHY